MTADIHEHGEHTHEHAELTPEEARRAVLEGRLQRQPSAARLLSAQKQEIDRINDNRIYLMGVIDDMQVDINELLEENKALRAHNTALLLAAAEDSKAEVELPAETPVQQNGSAPAA